MWSKLMLVMTASTGRQTLVESKPAAQADLDHGRLDAPPARSAGSPAPWRSRRRSAVRPGRRRLSAARTSPSSVGQLVAGDRLAVDLEALLDAAEVRRGEQAGAVAGAARGRRRAWPRSSPCPCCRRRGRCAAGRCGSPSRAAGARIRSSFRSPGVGRALLVVDVAVPEGQRLVVTRGRGHQDRVRSIDGRVQSVSDVRPADELRPSAIPGVPKPSHSIRPVRSRVDPGLADDSFSP